MHVGSVHEVSCCQDCLLVILRPIILHVNLSGFGHLLAQITRVCLEFQVSLAKRAIIRRETEKGASQLHTCPRVDTETPAPGKLVRASTPGKIEPKDKFNICLPYLKEPELCFDNRIRRCAALGVPR